jgi:hypothetical protein
LERPGHLFGIGRIHLAAVGDEVVFHVGNYTKDGGYLGPARRFFWRFSTQEAEDFNTINYTTCL